LSIFANPACLLRHSVLILMLAFTHHALSLSLSEPMYAPLKTLDDILFPPILPYAENHLKVSHIHSLWYAQYGNPTGVPVIVLHGGPGMGCGSNDMRYFDPTYYRIILFDQRGAHRSIPFGEVRENSSQHLISDIEALRQHLHIPKWLVFGGSWGSTLALLYGEAHPEYCLGFVLRGIFLGRKSEYQQFWYGMRDTYPESWDELQKFLPVHERKDLIHSYYKRLMNNDPQVHLPAARALMKYDLTASFLRHQPEIIEKVLQNDILTLGTARMLAYYGEHHFFLNHNQILNNLFKIQHLPAYMVHGRYDTLCRAKTAYELHQKWPGSHLTLVQDAGHAALEPGIAQALVAATEKIKTLGPEMDKPNNQ